MMLGKSSNATFSFRRLSGTYSCSMACITACVAVAAAAHMLLYIAPADYLQAGMLASSMAVNECADQGGDLLFCKRCLLGCCC
jgi:hypothetical protein